MPNVNLVVSAIRRLVRRTGEATGLAFYSRPRQFPVNYDVTVKNSTGESRRFYVVIPIPPNTDQQSVLHEPMFKPKARAIQTDERFGNRYAVFDGELKPGQVATFQEDFVVQVKPYRPWIKKRITFDEYGRRGGDPAGRPYAKFLVSDRYVQADDPRIKNLAEWLKGTETSVVTVLKRLNAYVVGRLRYGDPITGLYSSDDALTKKYVDCGGFDTLLAALAMSLGVPARIVSGFWAVAKTKNDMHAWLELMLPDGTWIPTDPSVEQLVRQGRSARSGRLGFAGSDRVAMSVGSDIPVRFDGVASAADILQHPFVWSEQGARGLMTQTVVTIPKVWRG